MSETFSSFFLFYSGVDEMNDNWLVVLDVYYPNCGDGGDASIQTDETKSTIRFKISMGKETAVIIF